MELSTGDYMAISYYPKLMREFSGEEITETTECFEILKINEDETSGFSKSEESIYAHYLTKAEMKKEMKKLDPRFEYPD